MSQLTDCTGLAALWCPVHGDCTCEHSEACVRVKEDRKCPLHGEDSTHAEPAIHEDQVAVIRSFLFNDVVPGELLRSGGADRYARDLHARLATVGVEQPEPVRWEWRVEDGPRWHDCTKEHAEEMASRGGFEVRELYTGPRPQAADEALREAYDRGHLAAMKMCLNDLNVILGTQEINSPTGEHSSVGLGDGA